nr:EOG090X0F7F [Triops cancriformis]
MAKILKKTLLSIDKTITFKQIKRKNLRKRKLSDEDTTEEERKPDELPEESEDLLAKLEETKERQKLRQKPHGVNVISLALGKKVTVEEEILVRDPFKANTGGMVDMKALKSGKMKQNDDTYDTGIGTQFSAETNTRDEDAEMMKYIDQELAKKKGQNKDKEKEEEENGKKYLSPEEAALQAVPEFLRKSYKKQSEEMLSNQMLSGIPEIDLGIEAKIKNIEATEEAKQKLLLEKMRKKDAPSHFVPTNYAVNFVQHNRFSIGDQHKKKPVVKEPEVKTQVTHVVGGEVAIPVSTEIKKKDEAQKATDDFYFEKFRRQFRR